MGRYTAGVSEMSRPEIGRTDSGWGMLAGMEKRADIGVNELGLTQRPGSPLLSTV